MEFTIGYFWTATLLIIGVTLTALYLNLREYRKTGKIFNKWFYIFAVLIFLQFFTNILKFDGTKTTQIIRTQNVNIELSKELPEKVKDNSFQREVTKSIKITKEDLK